MRYLKKQEMQNLHYLCSEYALVNEQGEVIFEEEGEKLCLINTGIIMLREGKIIFDGKDEQLRSSDDPFIKRFLRGK